LYIIDLISNHVVFDKYWLVFLLITRLTQILNDGFEEILAVNSELIKNEVIVFNVTKSPR